MTEVVSITDRKTRYIPQPVDKRVLRRQGEIEGELGVDLLLRRLDWSISNLETGKGGEILTVMPRQGPLQPFLRFSPADKLRGEKSHKVLFDSGATGVEISLDKSSGVSVVEGGHAVRIVNGLVGESTATFSLDRNGTISLAIPAREKHADTLLVEEGGPGSHSSLIYTFGKTGQLVINNVDSKMIEKSAGLIYVNAINEYGKVTGAFGSDGSVAVVLFPRYHK